MFEKEAEEIMMQKVIKENDCIMTPCKTLEDCQLYDFCFDDMVDAFKDGAEFGYNKANEWHYVKDGDLPKDEDWKWCVSYRGYYYVAKYEEMFGCWTNQEYSEVMQPYAWKEIVLPELPKESE